MTRRAAVFVVGLVAAALVGGRAARDPRIAARAAPDPRPRPAGRPRGHAPGGPAEGPQAHEGRPRPLGLDHALARRQARRRRAGDPDAGLRPDLDPAAGREGPRRGGRGSSARPRSSSSSTSSATSSRRRSTRARDSRSRRRSSTTCSPASRRSPRGARPTRTTSSGRRARQLVRGPVQTKESALAKWGGKLPPGHKLFAVPPNTVVVRCGAGAVVCPGVGQTNPTRDLLVPDAVHAARGAGDDRAGPEALGHAPGLRHAHRRADRPHGLHRQGRGQVRGRSRGTSRSAASCSSTRSAAGRATRAPFLQHFAIVLDREIKSWPTIDFTEYPGGITGLERRADLGAPEHQGGEGPRARAPDRRAARRVPHARPDGDLGDARQGLAARGEARGRCRPDRGRALPADLLPLPRARRGRRPDRLRGAALRRDPHLQRHAHAARASPASC